MTFILISVFISYNFVSYYYVLKKSKCILDLDNKVSNFFYYILLKIKFKRLKTYFISREKNLQDIGNPYGIDIVKYLFIKYILSFILFFILFYNSKSILYSIILFLIIYFFPDILVSLFKINESSKLINEISNIVQNIILSLSANMSLYNSLFSSINLIKYNRFKIEFENFINRYKMYNYNILKAVNNFENKFSSYEFKMFLSILVECEKEGNYIELLENFNESLEIRYIKSVNFQYIKNLSLTMFSIIVSLLNSLFIVGYPIIYEITSNMYKMFK